MKNQESPEQRRESLRQQELKNNPHGTLNDSFNRASGGGLVDLVNSLGWKGTGALIILAIIVYFLISYF